MGCMTVQAHVPCHMPKTCVCVQVCISLCILIHVRKCQLTSGSASTCELLRPSMLSTNVSALPFAKAALLPAAELQDLDETQWQQQRKAFLACIAAEDRRRAEAAQKDQQVLSLDQAM